MRFEEAVNFIKDSWRDIWPADKHEGIICPLCASGSGDKGSGITSNARNGQPHFLKCWACGFEGSAIDLIMAEAEEEQGRPISFIEAVEEGAYRLGIELDKYTPPKTPTAKEAFNVPAANKENKPLADYTSFYKQAKQALKASAEAMSYLKKRGLSEATIDKFDIGYCESWQSPKALRDNKAPYPSKRIIVKFSKNCYLARAIEKGNSIQKMNETGGGSIELFNSKVLREQGHTAIYITEGAFDAMSLEEIGTPALALNSTSNAKKLLEELSIFSTRAIFILCLDQDQAGKRATAELEAGLKNLGYTYLEASADTLGQYKDCNEYLIANREEFTKSVAAVKEKAARVRLECEQPDNIKAYIEEGYFERAVNKFSESANIKTGFKALDEKTGGIYSGLYVVAAASSLGKTTYCLQLADQIATAGHPVLFFSLEQSRLELVSKSLARTLSIVENGEKMKGGGRLKVTTSSLDIRKGYAQKSFKTAVKKYAKETAANMNIIQLDFGKSTVEYIERYAKRYMQSAATAPVVFIDYLQVLQPTVKGKYGSAKENIDSIVSELKNLNRNLNIPIFLISSINRANYSQAIDFESLKESGIIEYTADVVFGLQLACLDSPDFRKAKQEGRRAIINKAKAETPREIALSCLKNRYGVSTFKIYYEYYAKCDRFIER